MTSYPRSVMKTRSLLTLRGYTVDQFLEYEDKYVMYPTIERGESTIKSVVWILKEPKVVGVAVTKDLARAMEENDALEGLLVGGARFTPAAKKFAVEARIELVIGGYASFDIFGHELVPIHTIMSEGEVQELLDHYGITKSELPRVLKDDPAVRAIGAKVGQVVKIMRSSDTAGRVPYFRVVVDGR